MDGGHISNTSYEYSSTLQGFGYPEPPLIDVIAQLWQVADSSPAVGLRVGAWA